MAPLANVTTLVYSVDTDVFTLLLKHHNNIRCDKLLMHTVSGECIDISAVHDVLGGDIASALLSLHCLTGCDTVGKFNKKSKEFWTKVFLAHVSDSDVMQALLQLQFGVNDYIITHLARFTCIAYSSKYPSVRYKIVNLSNCRYFLFLRNRSNSQLLPPTLGAFLKHVNRTQPQLRIWANANGSIVPDLEPTGYGWELDGENYVPGSTDEVIAPISTIEMVSCNCKKGCKLKHRCSCKRSGENCTDFYGCKQSEYICENTDGVPEENNSDDEVEDM